MLVVDASVIAAALGDDGPDGAAARLRLRGEDLVAPEILDLEVASVMRRQLFNRAIDAHRAKLALADLAAMPIQRASHRALVARAWELRDNLTAYDAAYVALAEALDAPLITADRRLARAPTIRCSVEILQTSATPE